jgi:hypothetical protein
MEMTAEWSGGFPSDELYESHRVIRQPPYALGMRRRIADEMLITVPDPQRYLYQEGRAIQYHLGPSLIDALWKVGGRAMVDLRASHWRDHSSCFENLEVRAHLTPADIHEFVVPKIVTRHRLFPADWYCDFCGALNDGLKSPQLCRGCQGAKPKRYW